MVPKSRLAQSGEPDRFLFAVLPLPRALVANALKVQAAYSEYQERALARDALRRTYIGTLTLALALAVFGAVLLAIVLGSLIRTLLGLAPRYAAGIQFGAHRLLETAVFLLGGR